ncbi:cytochrome d ubiquinol oxidase subunit II, partial [Francisella tularensis subsp. holarctica]|nr:cytochrome d ubiquinol oxidase subunit II [Francisella tularensis subsp. holarctica]
YNFGFSAVTGITVIFGYSFLGATRLILKSERELFTTAKQLAKICCIILAVLMRVIGGMTPLYVKLPLENLYKMAILIDL